jgi:FkbM family methyltransferase
MVNSLLDSIHHVLGRSRLMTRLAVLVRNQCAQVIGYALVPSAEHDRNGEALLIGAVAQHVARAVDVGAHAGDWSALVRSGSPAAQLLLFEPQQAFVDILRDRFADSASEIVDAALGDGLGEAEFFAGHTAMEGSLLPLEGGESVLVRVSTLDLELAARGWEHADFVKIDAEGYDLHVLRGATNLLANHQIGLVQFEYNRPWAFAGSTLAAAFTLLRSSGYTVYLLRADGLYEFDYRRFGEFFAYSNFVAVAPGKASWIASLLRGGY